jgi:hypothetical protein
MPLPKEEEMKTEGTNPREGISAIPVPTRESVSYGEHKANGGKIPFEIQSQRHLAEQIERSLLYQSGESRNSLRWYGIWGCRATRAAAVKKPALAESTQVAAYLDDAVVGRIHKRTTIETVADQRRPCIADIGSGPQRSGSMSASEY